MSIKEFLEAGETAVREHSVLPGGTQVQIPTGKKVADDIAIATSDWKGLSGGETDHSEHTGPDKVVPSASVPPSKAHRKHGDRKVRKTVSTLEVTLLVRLSRVPYKWLKRIFRNY